MRSLLKRLSVRRPGAPAPGWDGRVRAPPGARVVWGALALLLLVAGLVPLGLAPVSPPADASAGTRGARLLPWFGTAGDGDADWEAAWARVAQAMDGDLMPALSAQVFGAPLPPGALAAAGTRPAADTYFMRHAEGFPLPEQGVQRRFQAAALSNDPQERLRILAAIAAGESGLTAYRALLEIARTGLRTGGAEGRQRSREALARALAVPGVAAAPRGDALFLRGYIALAQQRAASALNDLRAAVAADPYHFDARATLARALVATAPADRAHCLGTVLELLEQIEWLGVLAEDRRQFGDLAREFRAAGGGGPLAGFVVGFAAFLGGEPDLLAGAAAGLGPSLSGLPRECRAPLLAKMAWMQSQRRP